MVHGVMLAMRTNPARTARYAAFTGWIRITLLGSELQPPCGLGVGFGDSDDAHALDVHFPESELRDSVAPLRVHSEHLDRSAGEM